VLILWLAAIEVFALNMTIGQLIAFNMLLSMFQQPLNQLTSLWQEFLHILLVCLFQRFNITRSNAILLMVSLLEIDSVKKAVFFAPLLNDNSMYLISFGVNNQVLIK
jgi:ABC-type multidrug transport system fused ATPase/permease subunit